MVIMEELDEGWVTLEKVLGQQAQARAREAALRALSVAHQLEVPGLTNGAVHGDARDPNVMIKFLSSDGGSVLSERGAVEDPLGDILVKFVDFDWAGEHGVSRYPLFMSCQVNWAEGAGDQKVMMRQHDIELLRSGGKRLPFEYYSWHMEQG
jgi:Ser/Thr protein kinase RdoA (MazF antagonist)